MKESPSASALLAASQPALAEAPGRSLLDDSDRRALLQIVKGETPAGGPSGPPGEVRFDEPMARHTTLRIGGPADAWVAPATSAQVEALRAFLHGRGLPSRALGGGSNLLVGDGGVRGVLIASERLRGLAFVEPVAGEAGVAGVSGGAVAGVSGGAAAGDTGVALGGERRGGTRVVVGAGVSTGKLLSEAMRRGLGGVEFLGGVPGSVGGGLVMNAGTYLGEFTRVATRVRSVDAEGRLMTRDHAACGFVYRGSAIPPSEMIVEGELFLSPRPRAEIEVEVRSLRDRRKEREPHGVANAGSIFKNPPGDYAGRLIEACGLKGRGVGDAEISPVHANWIVNRGRARCADFLALIEEAREAVRARFGVELELEVKRVGDL